VFALDGVLPWLGCLLNKSGTNATRAGVYPLHGSLDDGADRLKIGKGFFLGLVVRMADVVSNQTFLLTVKATTGHKTSEKLK